MLLLLALSLAIDWFIGDPDALWRRVPHPVVAFGAIIDRMDWAQPEGAFGSFACGLLLLSIFLALALGFDLLVDLLPPHLSLVWSAVHVVTVVMLVAQKSLVDHVGRVAEGLQQGVQQGRQAVSMIVGRDVSTLDEAGVSRAAIESLAENASDGVVAPVFWYAVAGLPGIVFYKMVNTADSMIGHRTDRHEWFGKPAARLDDLMNIVPARLTAAMVAVAALSFKVARTALRDARSHRSPNAGWPEAAFAAALGLALGGPRTYGAEGVDGVWLNKEGRRNTGAGDIERALSLFRRLCGLQFCIIFGLGMFLLR